MPTYEYRCPECETVAEVNKRVRDIDEPYHCLSCGNVCQRQMSTNAFHLKGNCWARDNYRSKNAVPPGYKGKR